MAGIELAILWQYPFSVMVRDGPLGAAIAARMRRDPLPQSQHLPDMSRVLLHAAAAFNGVVGKIL